MTDLGKVDVVADTDFGEGTCAWVKVVASEPEHSLCGIDLISLCLLVWRVLIDFVVSRLPPLENGILLVHESIVGEI